jgi:hypothetical protein
MRRIYEGCFKKNVHLFFAFILYLKREYMNWAEIFSKYAEIVTIDTNKNDPEILTQSVCIELYKV